MKNNYLLLAEVLKRKRINLGLSQRELGRLSRVSHTEIYRIENGERLEYNLTILIKLCDVLGINIIELLIATGYLAKNYMEVLKNTVELPKSFINTDNHQNGSNNNENCKECPLKDILFVIEALDEK